MRAGSDQHDTRYTDTRTNEAYWVSLYLVLHPRRDAKTLQGRYVGLVGRTHIIGTGVWARQLGEPRGVQVVGRRAPGEVTKLLWQQIGYEVPTLIARLLLAAYDGGGPGGGGGG